MQRLKKLLLLQLLFLLKMLFAASQEVRYCGGIRIEAPPFHQNFSSSSSLLSHMILCKSEKLYFKTSIGLFQVSSIDYTDKHLTVSHTSCSSTSNFVSPHHLSAGFPLPSRPNSLVLFNCSNLSSKLSTYSPCNNTRLSGCFSSSYHKQELAKGLYSCAVVDEVEKLGSSFNPKQMNCTHYTRVYKSAQGFELGTRVSFDIPDHVPNPCDECERPNGNCGVGLRCVCHPMKCSEFIFARSFWFVQLQCCFVLVLMVN